LSIDPASGVISGTTTAVVTNLSITFQVTDSTTPTAQTATKTLSLTIGSATVTVLTKSLPDAIVSKTYPPQTLMATGGNPPYTWQIVPGSGRLPTVFALDPSTGIITGTPIAQLLNDIFTFTVQVTDSTQPTPQTATQFLSILVVSGIPSITTNFSVANGQVGVPYSFQVQEKGGTPPLTWSMSGFAPGLTLDPSTGILSGTPTQVVTNSRLKFVVTDSVGLSSDPAFLGLTITNGPPKITTASLPSGAVGSAYSATVVAAGGTTPYSWSATGLPSGLSINSSTGVISGTPQTAGTSSNVVVTVTDSTPPPALSAQATFSITITPKLAITTTSLLSGNVNAPYSSPVAATGGSTPYNWSATGLPTGLTINSSTGVIGGTPTVAGTSNNVVVTVTDSGSPAQTASATFSITIANKLSIVTASLPNGVVNASYSAPVAAVGGVGTLTWSASGLPSGLSINASTGVIGGTVTVAGTTSGIGVTVTDSSVPVQTATATFSITIAPQLVITTTTLPSGFQNQAYNAPVAATGGTGTLTWSLSGQPAGLTINSSTGVISGTPTTAGVSNNVVVTVTDSATPAQTAQATFSITITVKLVITTASPLPSGVVNTAYNFAIAASGGTGSLTWSMSGQPAGLTISSSTGMITGTPSAAGTSNNVVVNVHDSTTPTNQTATATFSITIVATPLSITTPSPLPDGFVSIPYSFQVASSGGTTPLTWSMTGQPSGLTINSSTGIISGTPTAVGTSTNVVVTVTDPAPETATKTYSLNIQPTPTQVFISQTSIGQNLQALVTVSVHTAPPTGSGGIPLTLTTGNPGVALLSAGGSIVKSQISFSIPENQTSVDISAEGVGIGQATLTASGTGYFGTGTVTVTPSGFTVTGPNSTSSFNMNQGGIANLTVTAVRLDSNLNVVGAQRIASGITQCQSNCAQLTVTVPLSTSLGVSVGTITPSVTFNSGDSTQTATFTAANTGNTNLAVDLLTANVPVAPPGFSTPAGGANSATANIAGNSCTLPAVAVGRNLATPARVTLAGQAQSTLQVVVSSLDSSKVLFSTTGTDAGSPQITLTIVAGATQSQNFFVYGVGSGALGSTSYSANAGASFGSCTNSATLNPAGFLFTGPNQSAAANFTIGEGRQRSIDVVSAMLDSSLNFAGFQPLAGTLSANVNVTSSDTTIGTIQTSPLTFTGGNGTNSTVFQSLNKAGSTTLSVSLAPGVPAGFSTPASAASIVGTVVAGTIFGLCGDQTTGPIAIGFHLEAVCQLQLSQPTPTDLTATLVVTAGSNLLLSSDPTLPGSTTLQVVIPAGMSSATYALQALGSSGTASYMASAPGFGSDSGSITMTPSGVVLTTSLGNSFTTNVNGATIPIQVVLAQLDPVSSTFSQFQPLAPIAPSGLTLSVSLKSSNTSSGTVTSPVTVAAGASSTVSTFTPGATTGQTIITATPPPSGLVTPANFNFVQINVQ
jgi:hypothetical protein